MDDHSVKTRNWVVVLRQDNCSFSVGCSLYSRRKLFVITFKESRDELKQFLWAYKDSLSPFSEKSIGVLKLFLHFSCAFI